MQNPIDPDKVALHPGLMEFPHHVGSAVIKPEDRGKIKSKALTAMQEQTHTQLRQLQQQMELLRSQAMEIRKRVEISEVIYNTEMRFEPLIGHRYFVYKTAKSSHVLSMVGPNEWGSSMPYSEFVSEVRLLADYTWDVISN
jgi:hypothetical protein